MVTETITVRETLSSEIYSVNQTEHKLMYQATQLLLDYIHHTQNVIYRISGCCCSICSYRLYENGFLC